MKRISEIIIITILSLIVVFHILILASVVPYDIVWGGRLSNQEEMIPFVLASTIINVLFLSIILIHNGILKVKISSKILKILIWCMMVFFLLNTMGNLLSESNFERWFFTPLTLILSASLLHLALNNRRS